MTAQDPTHQKKSQAYTVTIDEETQSQRLDNYLIRTLKGVPLSRIYRIIRKGEVRVNKGRTSAYYSLKTGDIIRIPPLYGVETANTKKVSTALLTLLKGRIIYESAALLIINKPSGLAVHGGSGINYGVIEALRQARPQDKNLELVHRLDRDTSGCLMIAKKRSMLRFLHQEMRNNKIKKTYRALVQGRWPETKTMIKAPLLKNTLSSGERIVTVNLAGKPSETKYRIIKVMPECTLVEATLITGRTHQIRVHCHYAGHPILGDEKYGCHEMNKRYQLLGLKRLFLHATALRAPLPDGTWLNIDAALPTELQRFC